MVESLRSGRIAINQTPAVGLARRLGTRQARGLVGEPGQQSTLGKMTRRESRFLEKPDHVVAQTNAMRGKGLSRVEIRRFDGHSLHHMVLARRVLRLFVMTRMVPKTES